MGEKRVYTVQMIVEVDVEDWEADTDAPLSAIASDLEDWARVMLNGPSAPRTNKWVDIASVIAGSVDQSCRWFAHCKHDATNVARHPIYGAVPVCQKHKEFSRR